MKHNLFLLLALVLMFPAFGQTHAENAEIDELYKEFNTVLQKYYPAEELGTSYKSFLSDLSQKKVNPEIIREKNIVDAFSKFRKTPDFAKIWKKNPVDAKKKYIINYESNFYKNLVAGCEDEHAKELLQETGKAFTSLPDLNPYIMVETYVANFKDENYRLVCVQKAISLTIYYDIVEQFVK